MINNNSEKLEHPGMYNEGVQPIGYNPQITKDYLQQEFNSLGAPVDGSSPAINPQPYYPEGGTILQSSVFEHSNTGIQEVNSYSFNNTDAWEAEVRAVEKEALMGRTIYNTAPTKSVMPNIIDVPKPTQAQLKQLQELELLRSMKSRLGNLLADEISTVSKLSGIRRSIESLKCELVNYEEELH